MSEQDDAIKALVDQAPPLTTEQRDRLSTLLAPARRLPCATKGCTETRPVVPIGSVRGYQWCSRCFARNEHHRPVSQ